VTESYAESRKNFDPDLEQKEKTKKIWIGWPANQSRSGTKKQKRGLVNDLDSLKNELWNAILTKKRKKTPKNELRQAPNAIENHFYFITLSFLNF
jgi:hypothetical protein